MIEIVIPQTMKKATFKIVFPTNYKLDDPTNELETSYEIEYSTALELKNLYEEARRVWSEFIVEVETDIFVMSDKPYQEQLKNELMMA